MSLLNGIRVLSVEHYGAGPYGTQLLADLGAEVVKVENGATGGDFSRSVGPYPLGEGDSQFHQTFSRGKKSVNLDLKSTAGRARFERLLAEADAVANNLRGDQPEKLRIRYADLSAIKPAIVCAHLSAYGRGNARAAWPGYDYLMQAECGFLSLTGEPEGPPARFGLSMVDFMTGSLMALSLVSAVLRARQTGQGCDVDLSLYDTALHQLSYPATWYLNEGLRTERLPRSSHPSIVPSQLFRTEDGWLFVMCQTPKFWALFCEAVQRPDLPADERFVDPPSRLAHRDALQAEIEQTLETAPSAHWMALLAGVVPVAPVNGIAEALDNPFAEEVGMLNQVEHPRREDGLRMLSSPFRIDGQRPPNRRAPLLGEHDDEFP
ncbi:MAG: CoA transferase [Gammaproteobacteria bacterium]|nr:CoA transferase [Gammaproteobacteria bacterium]MDE0273626.1 CoA transferase [Gammaproteobacteria bacterium]